MKGNNSPLHVVIFDEIDAVCKRRDDANVVNKSRVHDNVVNQLLTKIDGLATQNNLLVIGVTNRLDLLDEALLRPGRLEVHIEIPLPDSEGREQILNIHTKELKENSMLDENIRLIDIADRTRGFTGAELEGLVRSAVAFALAEHQETLATTTEESLVKREESKYDEVNNNDDMEKMIEFLETQNATVVGKRHFDEALVSVERSSNLLNEQYRRDLLMGNVVDRAESNEWRKATIEIETMANSTISSEDCQTRSMLIVGKKGSGRMTTIANVVESYDFESIQRVTPHDFLKRTDHHRLLTDIYENSMRSKKSIIIVENLEHINQLYNNIIPMLNVMSRTPSKSKTSLLIIITAGSTISNVECDQIVMFPTPTVQNNIDYCFQRSGMKIDFIDGIPFTEAHRVMENQMYSRTE